MNANPFENYMPVNTPDRLYGRDKIVAKILQNISSGPKSKELIGLTRIGKTSLLNIISCSSDPIYLNQLASNGIEPDKLKESLFVKVDFQGFSSGNLWSFLGRNLRRSVSEQLYERKTGPLWKDITDFEEFLSALTRLSANTQRIIFLFDEFDRIVVDSSNDILDNLRNVLNELRYVAYITATRKRLFEYYLERDDKATSSPLYNLFEPTPVYIGLLDFDESQVQHMVVDPAKEEGVKFTDQDLVFISDIGGLHPDLTRLVCKRMFAFRSENSMKVTDYNRIFNQVVEDFEPTYYSISRELSPIQIKKLLEVANHTRINLDELNTYKLTDLGLVVVKNTGPSLFSPILEFFLKKYAVDTTFNKFPMIWPDQRTITWGNKLWIFPQNEWKIFRILYDRIGQICTREELLEQISSEQENASDAALDITASRLRQKLAIEPTAPQLLTIRGKGYMLQNSK